MDPVNLFKRHDRRGNLVKEVLLSHYHYQVGITQFLLIKQRAIISLMPNNGKNLAHSIYKKYIPRLQFTDM